jgi:hypothetical protein
MVNEPGWFITNEFTTGNGTYDMVMYVVSNGIESITVADIDLNKIFSNDSVAPMLASWDDRK